MAGERAYFPECVSQALLPGRIAITPAIIVFPSIACSVLKSANPLLVDGAMLSGGGIPSTGNQTKLRGKARIARDIDTAGRAFSPQQCPLLALPVSIECADTIFSSVSSFLNGEGSTFSYAADRCWVGDGIFVFC